MQSYFKSKESQFTCLIVIFFLFGLIFHFIPFTQKFVLAITDVSMMLTNSIVFLYVFRSQKDNILLIWSILSFFLTYLIELAGVKTGLVFGNYQYGDTMLFQLYNVPIVIAMNWVILIMGSYSLALWIKVKTWIIPFLSSFMIVGFDFIMEKVAMKLDYWQWAGDIIPLQNYVVWFFISLIFTSLLALLKVNVENRILRVYFLVLLVFFLILRLGL